ncbi:hypothetical protein BCF53_102186 [Reinekea marinisedimentorum]|uniref:Uncharacterized protein n=1 Tax=Reinekea marinisedimentorum TaxID=230495 RepID=A0A4R3IA49_9GAMM|nr:hypothetical protein BCF53_102186 [Reinekea marinisedimentorum]
MNASRACLQAQTLPLLRVLAGTGFFNPPTIAFGNYINLATRG